MKIFRISNLLCLVAATALAVLLFWTSQAVQHKEEELAVLRKSLTQEEDTLRVLSVEWDYLNRPQRLEKMAVEQLGMQSPSAGEVIASAGDIPEPVIVNVDPSYYEEGIAQTVSLQPDTAPMTEPQTIASREEPISPQKAEKQSFDKLIQSLDAGGGGQ